MSKTERELLCDQCGAKLQMFGVPEPADEEGWKRVKAEHREGCEWVRAQEEKRRPA
jgi:hypothetical protein